MLAAERPDLVAMSGDQVSGFAWNGGAAWFEERWRQLLQPSLAAGVPHAAILGNHDGEAGLGQGCCARRQARLGCRRERRRACWRSAAQASSCLLTFPRCNTHVCGLQGRPT